MDDVAWAVPAPFRELLREQLTRRLLAFNGAYVLVSAATAIGRRNSEFVFYLVVLLLLGAAVLEVHRRVRLSPTLLWGLSGWGLAHMAGGLLPVPADWPLHGDIAVLYSLWLIPGWLKYDHLVHACGFGLTTWLCWEGLQRIVAPHRSGAAGGVSPTLGMRVLCAAAGMGFGALNEVVEFVATLLVPRTNVGGYVNTGWDLVSNLAGCLIAACLIRSADR